MHNFILKTAFAIITVLLAGCASKVAYASPQSVAQIQKETAQLHRVSRIFHRIVVSNSQMCTQTRAEYGFSVKALTRNANRVQRALQTEAYHLKKQPTVTFVIPSSAADKAGVRLGDAVVSVNSVSWSKSPSNEAFVKHLAHAMHSDHLRLGILHNGKERRVYLHAQKACDVRFVLSRSPEHLAWAKRREIVLQSGLLTLLKRDDELAFIMAHELAHILLGHTLPGKEKELKNQKTRTIMEKQADALGIQLIANAGFDPKASEAAIRSIDLIDSGPITRLLDYHGAYMNADERIRYLRSIYKTVFHNKNSHQKG